MNKYKKRNTKIGRVVRRLQVCYKYCTWCWRMYKDLFEIAVWSQRRKKTGSILHVSLERCKPQNKSKTRFFFLGSWKIIWTGATWQDEWYLRFRLGIESSRTRIPAGGWCCCLLRYSFTKPIDRQVGSVCGNQGENSNQLALPAAWLDVWIHWRASIGFYDLKFP